MSRKQFFIGYTTDDSQRLFDNGRIPRNFESNGVGYSSIKSARNGIAKVRREEADKHPREFGVYDGWGEPIINPVMDGLEFVPCVYCELQTIGECAADMLTREQVAARLRVSERTVERYVASGKLHAPVGEGRLKRWRVQDVRDFGEAV